MGTPTTFERKEVKYLISYGQRAKLQDLMDIYMSPDSFGKSTIMNIYYDTDNKQLIRHSMEKPVYKEKLRVRSYGTANPESTVFVELKKKYKGIVYKRRVSMSQEEAKLWLEKNTSPQKNTQITREIDYFTQSHSLNPAVLLSYNREAFFGKEDSKYFSFIHHNRDHIISVLALCCYRVGDWVFAGVNLQKKEQKLPGIFGDSSAAPRSCCDDYSHGKRKFRCGCCRCRNL